MTKLLRPVSTTLALTTLAFGCTSLLGDFTVSNDGAGSDSGGSDGTSADGNGDTGAPGDAPSSSDAPDAADFYVKCDGFKFPNPIVVESLDSNSGQNRFYNNGPPAVVTISDSVVHIVSRSGGAFTFFTINKNDPGFSGALHQPIGYQVEAVLPIRAGTGIMTVEYQAFRSYLGAYLVPGTQQPGAQLPPGISFELLPSNSMSRFASSFTEITPGTDYFYAYTNQPNQQNDGGANLFVGRTFPDGGTKTQVDNNTVGGASPILVHAGSSVYVYLSSDPSRGGAIAYKLQDDGTIGSGGAAPRKLTGGTANALMIAAGASPTPSQYDIAMIEFDPNSTTALATFRVGSVVGAQLDTFQSTDLPKGTIVNDTSELPINNGSGAWFGDEFAMIGRGSPATHPGLNFFWFDAEGHPRTRASGATALLASEPHRVNFGAIALASRLGTRYVTFNLVWSETLNDPDAGGDYDVMYLNELICH